MGNLKALSDFLTKITPSFRRARNVRNDIKTQYRKNIRNINSGRPVQTIIHYNTKWLGDKTEKRHMDVEVLYDEYGEEQTRGSTVVSGGERRKKYIIPDEHTKEVKDEMNDVISGIKMRNRLSIALEILTYLAFVSFISLLFLIISTNLGGLYQ